MPYKIFFLTHYFQDKGSTPDQMANFVYFDFGDKLAGYPNKIQKNCGQYNFIFDPYTHGLIMFTETGEKNQLVTLKELQGLNSYNRRSFEFMCVENVVILIAELTGQAGVKHPVTKKGLKEHLDSDHDHNISKIYMFRLMDIERSLYEPYLITHIDLKPSSFTDGLVILINDL